MIAAIALMGSLQHSNSLLLLDTLQPFIVIYTCRTRVFDLYV